MISNINSLTFQGLKVVDVDVQAHLSQGLPSFTVVGLPDKTIAESRERVRSAINSLGLSLPAKRITVNLSPADLLKEGSHFDLPIACCLLVAMGVLPENLSDFLILGELGLDGTILPVSGVLPAAVGAMERNLGVVCSHANGKEAAWSGNARIVAPKHLLDLINHFKGIQILEKPEATAHDVENQYPDMKDIVGQQHARRAIEITAAGGHNLLMFGPPGSGKSMLASRIPGILPKMTAKEILECSMIASIAGLGKENGALNIARPFRSPHQSCSLPALVGGGMGRRIKPGEISLAHNGVLFLDELAEFPRSVLESLRQPIEEGEVLISRASAHFKYPAKFQLIAAMNPCRCGYLSDSDRACSKAPKCAVEYQSKISGPLLDRIDMYIDVPQIPIADIVKTGEAESSAVVAKRVQKARDMQEARYAGKGFSKNADLTSGVIKETFNLDPKSLNLMSKAAERFKLSMRGYNRILKIARTIADLDLSEEVKYHHVVEAVSYRKISPQGDKVLAGS